MISENSEIAVEEDRMAGNRRVLGRRESTVSDQQQKRALSSAVMPAMQNGLNILHLEDDRLDADLIRDTLASQGIVANIVAVETEREFRASLLNGNIDLILSDYSLPGFNGMAALRIVHEINAELPFIFVSGTIGEEIAIESLKSGATDYVLKQGLQRLGLSVQRALSEVKEGEKSRRKDEALRNSETRYKLLFDSNPLPMWVYNLETLAFLAVNEAAIQHYGYSREEFLQMTVTDIRPSQDVPALMENIGEARKGLDRSGTWRHKKKDGSIIEVDITSHSIEFFGRPAEIVLANDITERRLMEEQLRLKSAALESAANAVMITEKNGRIIWVNSAFTETTGYCFAEALGQNPRMLKSGKQDPAFYQEMWKTILSGKVWRNTIINRCKDGTFNHEDLTITPIRNSAGKITHFVGIKQDITGKTRAEEALQASELRYRRLFESAKEGILILDPDSGQIVDVNPHVIEMLGFSKEELAGKELWEIGAFKDIVASRLAFAELCQRGYIRYENLPLESREGLVRQVEVVSNSYLAGESRVIQCNIRDNTEHNLAEEELRRTNQSLEGALAELQTKTHELTSMTEQLWQASKLATMGELAASIAHELNNPLATIALRAEALMEELPTDDPKFQSMKIISEEVERMASLVANLLQFSRRSQAEISTLDLREELVSCLQFIEHYLRSHNVDVVRDFARDLPNVHADRQRLRQVFLNLITNASDAMPEGGTLTLRAFSGVLGDRPAVVVEFSDNGTGVQTGDLPKLWEPFFTTKPEGKGTGLGLAICRRTVEEHHGIIDIETSPGKGATVRITLPATETGEITEHE